MNSKYYKLFLENSVSTTNFNEVLTHTTQNYVNDPQKHVEKYL